MPEVEIVITRDRLDCLIQALQEVSEVKSTYQFKVHVSDKLIRVTPNVKSIEVTL
jgi:hypothetical protein